LSEFKREEGLKAMVAVLFYFVETKESALRRNKWTAVHAVEVKSGRSCVVEKDLFWLATAASCINCTGLSANPFWPIGLALHKPIEIFRIQKASLVVLKV